MNFKQELWTKQDTYFIPADAEKFCNKSGLGDFVVDKTRVREEEVNLFI